MLDMLSNRQQELLTLLLETKSGLTVDELARGLQITRNAVRQHLAALEGAGVVRASDTRPSGGRPQQLYALSEKGHELFPRQYSLLAGLMLEATILETGQDGLAVRMRSLGDSAAGRLLSELPSHAAGQDRTGRLVVFMKQMGYRARHADYGPDEPVVEADNCVFHDLARQHPEVCQFDLALISRFTGRSVDHASCMVRGDNVCRFRLVAENSTD